MEVGALPGILALLIGIAGWFYLFYSRAASRLGSIESQPINRRRIALRRVNGGIMCLLAIAIAVGAYGVNPDESRAAFLWTWALVMALLLTMVVLGLLDLRLTIKLRRSRKNDR